MTIAFWCVLIAAYMPMLWTAVAKFSGGGFPLEHNRNPREFLDALAGYRKRAHWAQLNSFEAFPPFAAGVIIAQFVHAPQQWVNALAIAFVVLRLIYGVLYLADRASWRSAVWFSAVACVVGLFVIAA